MVRVIHAIKHHVLEGHKVPRCRLKIPGAGRPELIQRVLSVKRYQLVAQESTGACSDTANATGQSSRSRSIIGTTPDVDTVTRRRDRPYARSSSIKPKTRKG
jgi:hypothetical protein